jgi:hypothetical protein
VLVYANTQTSRRLATVRRIFMLPSSDFPPKWMVKNLSEKLVHAQLVKKSPLLKIQKVHYLVHKIPPTDTNTVQKLKFCMFHYRAPIYRQLSPVIYSLMFSQKIFCMHFFVPPLAYDMLRRFSYSSDDRKNNETGFSFTSLTF